MVGGQEKYVKVGGLVIDQKVLILMPENVGRRPQSPYWENHLGLIITVTLEVIFTTPCTSQIPPEKTFFR